MNKILCMYSGGIDSTGMLYEIFNKNLYINHYLHIHHVSLVSRRNRHILEKESVNKILQWFKGKYPDRKFKYTENIFDFNFRDDYDNEDIPDDTDVLYFIMAQIVRSDLNHRSKKEIYEKILIGETGTDIKYFAMKDPKYINPDLYQYRANKIYDTCFHGRFFEPARKPKLMFKPDLERPVSHLTKKEIIEMLPKELLDMTWSCRNPKKINNIYYECRRCITCRDKNIFSVDTLKQKLNQQNHQINIG